MTFFPQAWHWNCRMPFSLFRMFPVQFLTMDTAKFETVIGWIIDIDHFPALQAPKWTNEYGFLRMYFILEQSFPIGSYTAGWRAIFLPTFYRSKLFPTPLTFHTIRMPPLLHTIHSGKIFLFMIWENLSFLTFHFLRLWITVLKFLFRQYHPPGFVNA